MPLENSGKNSYDKDQSYKVAKVADRNPGASEKFFVRYVGKDELGNKIVGDLSSALVFTNVGIETFKYVAVPTLVTTNQNFSYLVSWPVRLTTKTFLTFVLPFNASSTATLSAKAAPFL